MKNTKKLSTKKELSSTDDLLNFRNTLNELKKYVTTPIEDDRDRAGIIQAFEFTFEQSWKAIQKIAAKQGVEIGNPKAAFSYAMQNNWIPKNDEGRWLELLKDRNLTTHTYQEDIAKDVLGRITEDYLAMFTELLSGLRNAI